MIVLGLPVNRAKQPTSALRKSLSDSLRERVLRGDAHWITVTEEDSPLKGRHLLIGGPRGEHGPILAAHGIPTHVIEKLGAKHSKDVEHVQAGHDEKTGEPVKRRAQDLTREDVMEATKGDWLNPANKKKYKAANKWLGATVGASTFELAQPANDTARELDENWRKVELPNGWRYVGLTRLVNKNGTSNGFHAHLKVATPAGEVDVYRDTSLWHSNPSKASEQWFARLGQLSMMDYGTVIAASRIIKQSTDALIDYMDIEIPKDYAEKLAHKKHKKQAKAEDAQAAAEDLAGRLGTLGVRAVQFNKDSQTAKQRQAVAQAAMQAFDCMSKVVATDKIKPVKLILGKLTLMRGRTLAYYTHGDHAITIGDKQGYGPFFHEYGHAVDFGLGGVSGSTSGPWHDFMEYVKANGAHPAYVANAKERMAKVREAHAGSTAPYAKDLSYVRQSHEIFARFFAEWVQYRLEDKGGVPPELKDSVPREKWRDHPEEWKRAVSLFETALESQGIKKALLAAIQGPTLGLPLIRKSAIVLGLPIGQALRKSAGEHWITIHPEGYTHTREGDPTSGRHVLIDGDGHIVGGAVPKDWHGKTFHEALSGSDTPPPHRLARDIARQGRDVRVEHSGTRHTTHTGLGYQQEQGRYGPEAKRGHIRVSPYVVELAGKRGQWVAVESAFADKEKLRELKAEWGPKHGHGRNWYVPLKSLPMLAARFHAEIPHETAEAYEAATKRDKETGEYRGRIDVSVRDEAKERQQAQAEQERRAAQDRERASDLTRRLAEAHEVPADRSAVVRDLARDGRPVTVHERDGVIETGVKVGAELGKAPVVRESEIPHMRIPVKISYEHREAAKAAGAKWDSDRKVWTITASQIPALDSALAHQGLGLRIPKAVADMYAAVSSGDVGTDARPSGVQYHTAEEDERAAREARERALAEARKEAEEQAARQREKERSDEERYGRLTSSQDILAEWEQTLTPIERSVREARGERDMDDMDNIAYRLTRGALDKQEFSDALRQHLIYKDAEGGGWWVRNDPRITPPKAYFEARQRERAEASSLQERRRALTQELQRGERPGSATEPVTMPQGEKWEVEPWNLYGGGESIVADGEHVWLVRNNGADGDDWSRNNVRTGGAGAIGWRTPQTPEIMQRLRGLFGEPKVRKALAIGIPIHGDHDGMPEPRTVKAAMLAIPVRKGYLTDNYGEGPVASTPDAGKEHHQAPDFDAIFALEKGGAVTFAAPTENSVWAVLHHMGLRFEVRNHTARIGAVTVTVNGNRVTVSGEGGGKLARRLEALLGEMQTSEDWVDGRQSLSGAAATHGTLFGKALGIPIKKALKGTPAYRKELRRRKAMRAWHNHRPLTAKERKEAAERFGAPNENGHWADGASICYLESEKGYVVYTHRARTKAYPSIASIPRAKVRFIASTA